MKKKIAYSILALLLIGSVAVYMLWNKPHRNVKSATATEAGANQLYDAFTRDTITANRAYLNKIVSVTGTISGILENQENQQVILLKTNTDGGSINCTLEEKAVGLNPGITVTVKGICSGYISGDADMGLPGDVFLIRCYFTK